MATRRQMELERAKQRLFKRVAIEKQNEKVKESQARLKQMRKDLRDFK